MQKYTKEELEYLNNRYADSSSLKETIYRIKHNIEDRPVCKGCGGKVKFVGGTRGFNKYCSRKCCAIHDNNFSKEYVKEKIRQTCLERYGVVNGGGSDTAIKKIKATKLKHYGDEKFVNPTKAKQTKLEKYGDENYNNIKQNKQTCLERYGVEFVTQLSEFQSTVDSIMFAKYGVRRPLQIKNIKDRIDYNEIVEKSIKTKRNNNTFNKSKSEDKTYDLLCERFDTVLRQYKNELYPHSVDFYIPENDLYIEANYFWMHGGHEYEPNNILDKEKLNIWKQKFNEGKLAYKQAIYTWTVLDKQKFNDARNNKLNYVVFYKIDDFKEWIKNY